MSREPKPYDSKVAARKNDMNRINEVIKILTEQGRDDLAGTVMRIEAEYIRLTRKADV